MLRREIDIILVIASSLALTAVILTLPAEVPARVALGLPFVLLLPGYALTAALFPRRDDLDASARIALSVGLSLAIVPLIALALNYSTWGIRLHPILAFVTLFIALASAFAAYRRHSLSKEAAFGLTFDRRLLRRSGAGGNGAAVALTGILALAALGFAGYFAVTSSGSGEAFTEFYVLGPGGAAGDYPRQLTLGESASSRDRCSPTAISGRHPSPSPRAAWGPTRRSSSASTAGERTSRIGASICGST